MSPLNALLHASLSPAPNYRTLASLVVVTLLTSCGGGGDSATPSTAAVTTGSVSSSANSTPSTTPSLPVCNLTAKTGPLATDAYTRVNYYRNLVGLPALTMNPTITQAAGNQANYLSLLPSTMRSHTEVAGGNCYTGVNILNRLSNVGYSASIAEEEFTELNYENGSDSIDTLFDAIYHRMGLLANYANIGIAWQTSSMLPPTVLTLNIADKGTGYTANTLITYPFNGQANVKADWYLDESPCPLGCNLNGQRVGYPISIQSDGGNLQVASFIVKESVSGANVLGTALTASTDINLGNPSDRAAFIPSAALKLGTSYTVTVTGNLNGTVFNKTWQFTTSANTPLTLTSNASPTVVAKGQSFTLTFAGGSRNYYHVTNGVQDTLGWTYTATSSTASSPVDYVIAGNAAYTFTNNGKCTVTTGCSINFTGMDSFGQATTTSVIVMP